MTYSIPVKLTNFMNILQIISKQSKVIPKRSRLQQTYERIISALPFHFNSIMKQKNDPVSPETESFLYSTEEVG